MWFRIKILNLNDNCCKSFVPLKQCKPIAQNCIEVHSPQRSIDIILHPRILVIQALEMLMNLEIKIPFHKFI